MPARISVIVGTRPEAVKMAPVLRALRRRGVATRLVCTGQHEELLDDVFPVFDMVPDANLEIMKPGQSLFRLGSACLEGMGGEYAAWRPDLVLVQGDTASAFFGALAAFFSGIPVGHVEAGLRSGDMARPFPEEAFRRLIDGLATLHFCPSDISRDNLLREGVNAEAIHVTGNTVVDALLDVAGRGLEAEQPDLAALLADGAPRFVLVTAHRRESFGPPMEALFGAIADVAADHPDVEILFPVHPNPSVREPAERVLAGNPRIRLVAPLTYPDLVLAVAHAALVLTDSGGIQEEAPTFGTPVLVLRDVTDRPEGIRAGVAELVGTDARRITTRAAELLGSSASTERTLRYHPNPHGDGRAGERIADIVVAHLEEAGRPG